MYMCGLTGFFPVQSFFGQRSGFSVTRRSHLTHESLAFFFLEIAMAYRKKMARRKSRRDFTRKSGSHRKNFRARPQRGGIRL